MLRHGLGRARALAGGRRPSLSANAAALRRRPAAGLQLPPRPLAVRCLCSGPGGPGGGGSGDGGGDGAVPLGLPEPAATPAAGGGGSKQALGRVGGVKTPGAKISMTFTCDVCETRSTKIFHRHSYENGTVIVRCPGCDNLHLVADNLGWFLDGPEGYNIETILATKGQSVRRAADDEEDAAEFLPDGTIHVKKSWQIKSQRHSPRGKSQCRPVANGREDPADGASLWQHWWQTTRARAPPAMLLLLPVVAAATSSGVSCEKTILGKKCDAWGDNDVRIIKSPLQPVRGALRPPAPTSRGRWRSLTQETPDARWRSLGSTQQARGAPRWMACKRRGATTAMTTSGTSATRAATQQRAHLRHPAASP
jgi:hypothetical protein